MAQSIHLGEREIFCFGDGQHTFAFGVIEEFAFFVEQLEGVPLLGVMAGGEDNTSCGFLAGDGQFGSRRGCQPDIHHIVAHAHECTANDGLYHVSAQTGVATYNYHIIIRHRRTALCRIGGRETNDIHGVQPFTNATTDRAADTGNRFN